MVEEQIRSFDEIVVDDDEMNTSPIVCNFSNSFSILFILLYNERWDGKKMKYKYKSIN